MEFLFAQQNNINAMFPYVKIAFVIGSVFSVVRVSSQNLQCVKGKNYSIFFHLHQILYIAHEYLDFRSSNAISTYGSIQSKNKRLSVRVYVWGIKFSIVEIYFLSVRASINCVIYIQCTSLSGDFIIFFCVCASFFSLIFFLKKVHCECH